LARDFNRFGPSKSASTSQPDGPMTLDDAKVFTRPDGTGQMGVP
jgi:hypothetical protein